MHETSDTLFIDDILPSQVVWDPYTDVRERHPRPQISLYVGCLKCVDVVEPYHPDRVQRQFGMIQLIPQEPIEPDEGGSRGDGKQYTVEYGYTASLFERWQNHLLAAEYRGGPILPGQADCDPGYMDWYRRVSHVRIENPKYRIRPLEPPSEPAPPQNVAQDPRIDAALKLALPIIQRGRPSRRVPLAEQQALYDVIVQMSQTLGYDPDAASSAAQPRSGT